jgi:hypothetical protein
LILALTPAAALVMLEGPPSSVASRTVAQNATDAKKVTLTRRPLQSDWRVDII